MKKSPKKAKVFKPRGINRTSNAAKLIEAKHVGVETVDWSKVSDKDYRVKFYDTLRHYGYFFDNKDHYSWALAWAKKNNPIAYKKIKAAPVWAISSTFGSICKMLTNGMVQKQSSKIWFDKAIHDLPEVDVDDTINNKIDRKSPAELVKENTSEFIANIEVAIDNKDSSYDVYEELKKNDSAGITAKRVVEFYEPLLEEIEGAISRVDEQLVEGYNHLTMKEKKEFKALISNIISGANKFLGAKKATRKIRQKKVISADVKITKFPYLNESKEYQIVSVNPINIVGAQEVVMFNTKTKHLTYLVTDNTKGFDIKGATIYNIDGKLSFKKVVRKPEIVSAVLPLTKSKAQKYMESIKTVKSSASGRSNSDMILLKFYK